MVRQRKTREESKCIELYRKYYLDRDYEQVDLFKLLDDAFTLSNVVYPGSFVHISPSFVFPNVTYIDSDRQARGFFDNDKQIKTYIRGRKAYKQEPNVTFVDADYRKIRSDLLDRFDLLISQYAGFVSEACKPYLKVGGLLLVNNSHGDAGLAAVDEDFELIATVHVSRGKYRISYTDLAEYFVPKNKVKLTQAYLHDLGKGVGYIRTAPLYLFRRIS